MTLNPPPFSIVCKVEKFVYSQFSVLTSQTNNNNNNNNNNISKVYIYSRKPHFALKRNLFSEKKIPEIVFWGGARAKQQKIATKTTTLLFCFFLFDQFPQGSLRAYHQYYIFNICTFFCTETQMCRRATHMVECMSMLSTSKKDILRGDQFTQLLNGVSIWFCSYLECLKPLQSWNRVQTISQIPTISVNLVILEKERECMISSHPQANSYLQQFTTSVCIGC